MKAPQSGEGTIDHGLTRVHFPPSDEVLDAMRQACLSAYNPGSQHALGRAARRVLLATDEALLTLTHQPQASVIYCASQEEAWALAVWGTASARRAQDSKCNQILVVGEALLSRALLRRLTDDGFVVRRVPDARAALSASQNCAVVALSAATCCFVDRASLDALAQLTEEPAPPFFVDATGLAPSEPMPRSPGCLWLIGGEEMQGPSGIYALIKPRGLTMWPLYAGGSQMEGVRPGTESVVLIAGLGAAARQSLVYLSHSDRASMAAEMAKLVVERLTPLLGPSSLPFGHRELLPCRVGFFRPSDGARRALLKSLCRTQLVAACIPWDGPEKERQGHAGLAEARAERLFLAWPPSLSLDALGAQLNHIVRAFASAEEEK